MFGPRPIVPFGNLWSSGCRSQLERERHWQANYGNIYGLYYGTTPVLTVAEPALIRQVLETDFCSFSNRDSLSVDHEIWRSNLYADFYLEPDRFKPERFLSEIPPCKEIFLPFGCGPRQCIGAQLACHQLKLCLAKFVMHFRFFKSDKTVKLPLSIKTNAFLNNNIQNGLTIRVKRRKMERD